MRQPEPWSGPDSGDGGDNGDNQDSHIVSVADFGVDPHPRPAGPAHRRSAKVDDEADGWKETLLWFGVPVVIVLLIRLLVFGFYSIPSGSMMDTIEIGDRVITSQLTPRFLPLHRGDVIVFKDPAHWLNNENSQSGVDRGDHLIKRLIGMPGDVVSCKGGRRTGDHQWCGHQRNRVYPPRRGAEQFRLPSDRHTRSRIRYG